MMMPTFPIPVFVAALLTCLGLHLALRVERAGWLAGLVLACAVQAMILSLVQHYGFDMLRPLQALGASVIPPLGWIAFTNGALRPLARRDLVHLATPLGAAVAVLAMPGLLDPMIALCYLGYGGAIVLLGAYGTDALPRVRLDTGELPRRFWICIGATLILSALADVAILWALITGQMTLPPLIISTVTSLTFLVLGWVSLSPSLTAPAPTTTFPAQNAGSSINSDTNPIAGPMADPVAETDRRAACIAPAPAAATANAIAPDNTATSTAPQLADRPAQPSIPDDHTALIQRLDALMDADHLYLDPDLTLDRLARRLRIPRKTLSTAINTVSGDNVSRYINARRIAHACDQLRSGKSVTETWLSSGFNTKSNFNREFQRIKGCTPSAFASAPLAQSTA